MSSGSIPLDDSRRAGVEPAPERDVRTDEMIVSMGPQHPSTHGLLRVVLRIDGELVVEAMPQIGYLHRCVEKIGERVSARQFVPYTDRLDYLAAMNMNLGWSLAVEKLLGVEVSGRARHLGVLMCELNRIASHLVAACSAGLDVGSFTPFMWCFRERERILDLFEEVCGARLTYSYIVPGGVMADLPEGWPRRCLSVLDGLEPVIGELHAALTSNAIFIGRMAGVGVLPAATAIAYGCSGPVLRGSGVAGDLRRDGEPIYARMYDGYRFEVVAQVGGRYPNRPGDPQPPREAVLGDCWHRFYVRMLEVVESIGLVRQAIEFHARAAEPLGPPLPIRQKLPRGEAYLETEAPKGQMGFMIVGDGSPVPYRVRVRSSSFSHTAVMPELCRGCLLADLTAIIGSLDIVLGEIDR